MTTLEDRVRKLEDESAIRDLAAAFADAASRNDKPMFAATWKHDGVFTIGEPLPKVCHGTDEIVAFFSKLRDDKEFFVQFVHSGVVKINGDTATAQWLLREVGKGAKSFYHNYGFFSDALEKVDGKWLFAERFYHYAYLDFSPFTGNAYVLPEQLASKGPE